MGAGAGALEKTCRLEGVKAILPRVVYFIEGRKTDLV